MAKGKQRDLHKEQQWRRWLRAWRASGWTVRAFCAEHGLSEQSFYAWRRTLSERDAEGALFVPVQVVADKPSVAAGALELVVSGNRTVLVRPGFDAATLRQLLAVLEDKPC
jgi:hypothetical protein